MTNLAISEQEMINSEVLEAPANRPRTPDRGPRTLDPGPRTPDSGFDFLFIIQGEGRGHMTQALALQSILAKAGHRISAVLIGGDDNRRRVPAFFTEKIGAPITCFESPNFAIDETQRSIKVWATLVQNLKKRTGFIESMSIIRLAIDEYQPDAIINFFEPLAGIYKLFHRPGIPMLSVGHQYMYMHPAYPFPPGKWPQRVGAKYFTRITSFDSDCRLALSFYYVVDRPRLRVLPPLLRAELFQLPLDRQEDFFLIYLLNQGYAEAIIEWHQRHPEVELHCFWDNPDYGEIYALDDTLAFHQLSDTKFLEMMSRCRGLICTAGFESVCEAMYLGKPILSVPVKGHVEQYWNALDLAAFGGGLYDTEFNIERLFEVKPIDADLLKTFRGWVDRAPALYLSAIEETVRAAMKPRAEVTY